MGTELFFEFGVGGFDGLDEEGVLAPVVEGGAVDLEFRGDGGNLESEAESEGGGGLDRSQVGVRAGGVLHTAPRMAGGLVAFTIPSV